MHLGGVPPVNAAKYLGHTLQVHLDTYLFAADNGLATAATRLGQVLAEAAAAAR